MSSEYLTLASSYILDHLSSLAIERCQELYFLLARRSTLLGVLVLVRKLSKKLYYEVGYLVYQGSPSPAKLIDNIVKHSLFW